MRQAWSQFAHSVRFQLTLWYSMALAIILLALGGYIYFSEESAWSEAVTTQLHQQIEQLLRSYNEKTGLFPSTSVTAESDGKEVVLLLTPQGNVAQAIGAISPELRAALVSATMHSQGQLGTTFIVMQRASGSGTALTSVTYGFTSVVLDGPQPGWLLIVGIPSDVPSRLQDLLAMLLLALPVTWLLLAGGGFWLVHRAIQPVQAITRLAQQISESDLSQRLRLIRRDEVGELAATFDHMLARLEAAFERQRQFTADALRTPLTIIDLEANRALSRPLTSAEYRQTIALIRQENSAMARLVGDLLMLARADDGQVLLKRETVDLSEVVLETVERLTPLACQEHMTMKLGAMPELLLQGDRQYLVQLVTNLIENAVTHSAGTGKQVSIETGGALQDQSTWLWLRISDDGPGIAAEHLPHLFERFYRIDLSRTHTPEGESSPDATATQPRGSGLGLSIVQWIAEAHGGRVQVQSVVGHGSVFEVWLPTGSARW